MINDFRSKISCGLAANWRSPHSSFVEDDSTGRCARVASLRRSVGRDVFHRVPYCFDGTDARTTGYVHSLKVWSLSCCKPAKRTLQKHGRQWNAYLIAPHHLVRLFRRPAHPAGCRERADVIHVDDVKTTLRRHQDHALLVWENPNLLRMIHRKSSATRVNPKGVERRFSQRAFKSLSFHKTRLPRERLQATAQTIV